MGHFSYSHLPAQGIGARDPRRPYVSGGLGDGVSVFITDVLERRIYRDAERDLVPTDRAGLEEARVLIVANRDLITSERMLERLGRALLAVERELQVIQRRSMATGERSFLDQNRDLN